MKPNLTKIDIPLQERKKAIHEVSGIRKNISTLQYTLFKIVEKKVLDENNYRYRIELIEDSEIFKVHFPSQPITPGSCILDMAKELIEDFLNKRMTLKEANHIRFFSPISPVTDPIIDFCFEKKVNENEVETTAAPVIYKVSLVIREKDATEEEGILAEMLLVLEEK